MASRHSGPGPGLMERRLWLGAFHSLAEELTQWQIAPEIVKMQRKRDPGLILPFVKGLRLSARLVYIIRDHLSSLPLEVSWGHLLSPDGDSCSPECDVIIHEEGHVARWNGTSEPVMDFKFISSEKAVAVVSCKSGARSVDREYPKRLKPYVKNVLLFAERCAPSAVARLKRSAREAGYKGFWYLYTLNAKTAMATHDENVWVDFLQVLRRIASRCVKEEC